MKAGGPLHTAAARVVLLGSAQLVAWGTLYYAIAVIGEPMRRALGLSSSGLFAMFAWSMALSGFLAPWAGRVLDRRGGRLVLLSSTAVGALGFALLSIAPSAAWLFVGWSLNGIAMALGLYETCFAALGQVALHSYRRTVTGVTLLAGLASSCAWPASHYLLETLGWRATCQCFAAALLLCAPLYAIALPSAPRPHAGSLALERDSAGHAPSPMTRRRARRLSVAFAGMALISAAVSAHLVQTLKAFQFSAAEAVWIGSSIGVMQVLGRVWELLSARQSAVRLGFWNFLALTFSTLLLWAGSAAPWLVFGFALIYGAANGVLTIVKALLPLEILGARELGSALGTFGAPSLVARAVAPLGFAALSSGIGAREAVACMVAVGVLSVWAYAGAVSFADAAAQPRGAKSG